MRRLSALLAALALTLSGCSTSLDSKRQADGHCIQERSKKFLGITYSTNQYRVNCESQ